MDKYLEAGRVANTHGIAGLVRFDPWCDSPSVAANLKVLYIKTGEIYLPIKIERASVYKTIVLMKLEGCETFEDANRYKGKILYCDRSDIPRGDGDIFIADLIGLPVIDADDGTLYGKLIDVVNRGASDLYEIKRSWGDTAYLPAVKEFVTEVNTEKGIFVRPIKGIFDDEPIKDSNGDSDEV